MVLVSAGAGAVGKGSLSHLTVWGVIEISSPPNGDLVKGLQPIPHQYETNSLNSYLYFPVVLGILFPVTWRLKEISVSVKRLI